MKLSEIDIVSFDLDDTLAPSKSPLPPEMGVALANLLNVKPVCVISGGSFDQFQTQLLAGLGDNADLENLHLMPTCGTRYFRYRGGKWVPVYEHDLSTVQKQSVIASLERNARRLGLWESDTWGPIIEDRGSQITFSALGQNAPLDAKRAWDPDGSKKRALVDAVAPDVPDLEVRGGGSTSVDITEKGVDKAYGMSRLAAATGFKKERMLFVGDRLDLGGNDYPVLRAGWPTCAVSDWEDTLGVINDIIAGEVRQ